MRPLVIYGAGGSARDVLELVRDINSQGSQWDVLGFLSDDEESWGQELNEIPVLGGIEALKALPERPVAALAVGGPHIRKRMVERIRPHVDGFPTLTHPAVISSSSVTCGEGVVITAGNILTANIRLGDFVMVNLACTITHDCVLGDFVTLSPGVNISGNVHIGEGTDVGTGGAIIQGVKIGEWSILGAGALVARDVPPNTTAVGVPAKVIKEREAGWHLK